MTLVAWMVPAADHPTWMWRETVWLVGAATGLAVVFVFATARRAP